MLNGRPAPSSGPHVSVWVNRVCTGCNLAAVEDNTKYQLERRDLVALVPCYSDWHRNCYDRTRRFGVAHGQTRVGSCLRLSLPAAS